MNFKVGDKVFASDWCEGVIVELENDTAYVEFSTIGGGGCLLFGLDELQHIPNRVATLRAFESAHGTVNVVIQNCSPDVLTLLRGFDIWLSDGRYEWDENKPKEKAKIWFECPMEFLYFVESTMGRKCFERMGVEEFYVGY